MIPFTCKPPRPDHQLEEKLKAEWPGILRWMIEGCLDWQANGLVRPAIVAEATAEYFDDQDTFGQWLDEYCLRERNAFEVQAKLYASWKAFAERQGDRPGSSKGFSANLIRRGFEADRSGSAAPSTASSAACRFASTPLPRASVMTERCRTETGETDVTDDSVPPYACARVRAREPSGAPVTSVSRVPVRSVDAGSPEHRTSESRPRSDDGGQHRQAPGRRRPPPPTASPRRPSWL